jgi:hypothetical protein
VSFRIPKPTQRKPVIEKQKQKQKQNKQTIKKKKKKKAKNHHDQKRVGEERIYSTYTSTSQFITEGSQDRLKQARNLKERADAEAMEGCCLLACFPWLAQPAF